MFLSVFFFITLLPNIPIQPVGLIKSENNNFQHEDNPVDFSDELNSAYSYIVNTPRNVSQIYNQISNTPSANSRYPKSVIDSQNNVHFVWEEWAYGDADILYAYYNFTSKTFSSIYNVSDSCIASVTMFF